MDAWRDNLNLEEFTICRIFQTKISIFLSVERWILRIEGGWGGIEDKEGGGEEVDVYCTIDRIHISIKEKC